MRIFLILLSITSLFFLGWMGVYALKNNTTWHSESTGNNQNIDSLTIDIIKTNAKLESQVEELNKKIEQISGWSPTVPKIQTTEKNQTDNNNSQNKETNPGWELIPISAKFLSKVLPTIEPSKSQNAGIFDLAIFDKIPYTTYKDEKFGITIVASMFPYANYLKNFQSLDKTVYTVNETKAFPFEAFYVNPPKADATVRIVMKVEAQTLLISLPKSKFKIFKDLLLKKK